MSAFDDLRATLAAAPPDAVCVWGTVEQLRDVVAEYDALRRHACGAPLRPEEQRLVDELLRGAEP